MSSARKMLTIQVMRQSRSRVFAQATYSATLLPISLGASAYRKECARRLFRRDERDRRLTAIVAHLGGRQFVRLHNRHLVQEFRAARYYFGAGRDPLTFLGGAFYTIDILPPIWRTVSLFNPVVHLVSRFRWSFYGLGDVSVASSLGFTGLFIAVFVPRTKEGPGGV
jgi:hypothetical protein